MAGAGKSVTTHTTVIFFLISGLPAGGQAYNHITRTDIGIVDDIRALHAASYRRVYDNGAYQVADIGRFAAGGIYAYTHFAKFCQQFIRSVDNGGNYFSRNEQLIASDSA